MVFGVTAAASCKLAFGKHDVVEVLRVLLDLGVAGQAAIAQALAGPGRRVAFSAAGYFSVRGYPYRRLAAGLGTERTRTEKARTANEINSGHEDYDDPGRSDGAGAQTTEPGRSGPHRTPHLRAEMK